MQLSVLERSLNKALSYNPQSKELLTQLSGKQLAWDVASYGLTLCFSINEKHITVQAKDHPNPSCWIKADPKLFVQLFNKDIQNLNLNIKGDLQVLFHFIKLFSHKELDWVVMLSDYFPAFFVNEIVRFCRKIV